MPLQNNELARREQNAIELRDAALRVNWTLPALQSSDGHDITCLFGASVRAVQTEVERLSLAEVLLADRAAVTAQDVAAHFQGALLPAAVTAAKRFAATALLDREEEVVEAMRVALQAAAKPVAFACGVDFLPPFSFEFHSESFQKQKVRSMQQALIQQQQAGELQQLERAADMLKRFEAIRRDAPELSAGRVLEQIAPSDRGVMLRTLQLASAKNGASQSLWVAAGNSLARIDPMQPSRAAELIELPGDLGPLRSVQPADGMAGTLLVGAQRGFFVLRGAGLKERQAYQFPAMTSPLGFNRVVAQNQGQTFFGTHGDAGLVRWDAATNDAPVRAIAPGQFSPAPAASAAPQDASMMLTTRGPRHLFPIDDRRLLFSAGPRLFAWTGENVVPIGPEARGDVIAIIPTAAALLIVRDDGSIQQLDRAGSLETQLIQRRPNRLRAAGALPWLDGQRLLLASEDGSIACIGLEDQLVTEYLSPHRGLRMVAGSAALVAAVSPDRQRLIIWNAWDGQRPAGEIYLTALTRHRAADMAFG